jgi:quercetin dioxygenase-like cupin family protein
MLSARLERAADAIIAGHYTCGADFPNWRSLCSATEMDIAHIESAGRMSPAAALPGCLEGTMKKVYADACRSFSARMVYVFLACLCLLLSVAVPAQAPKSGIVRKLSDLQFPPGDGPDCLQFVLENGDLKTGPTTAIMKAAPKCVVPPHYHTAEEQLLIVKGNVSTGMEGMADTVLGPGGFAMMPSKAPHWFTCTAQEECLMFVTFDRPYDIVWLKPKK